ncbi:multicopper oxidase family protein, partial [Noviherbaspirillum denitrificans]|uniref:multicopper oxidase family protein n=1 Tax=Noviherbaspirillum denitrificans TaxID=1968433 RepID=UPI001132649A
MSIDRRRFLLAASALGASSALPGALLAAPARNEKRVELTASIFGAALDPSNPTRTSVWGFNEQLPGPALRFRRGDKVHFAFTNDLQQDSAVHWHGIRVPNAMDGVPHVTQYPVEPGDGFDYRFEFRDSGTFWYHPHQSSFEQVPRGLYGALIVEEDKPPVVDRDEVWVLSDIKLDEQRQQVEDFGRILDIANEGRLGNQLLVNGLNAGLDRKLDVRAGERVRLRLVNAASARFFRLAVEAHDVRVIAYDGQGVAPHVIPATGLPLGPGMRADLIIDCMGKPGQRFAIRDLGRPPLVPASDLGVLAYSDERAVRSKPLSAPVTLAPNRIPEPDLRKAAQHVIMFQGGMRGQPVIGMVDGKPSRIQEIMAKQGLAWTMNYNAQHEHALMHEPFLHLKKGESVILRMINDTAFDHPMHLHGHFFRVLAVNGKANARREWRDTVIMGPRQTI